MLPFDSSRWKSLSGGYGIPYDASSALRSLEEAQDETSEEAAWAELWEELHHQGDVGEASYAAVPHLVRIAKAKPKLTYNYFALIAVIELARTQHGNPAVPPEDSDDYGRALAELMGLVATHPHQEWDAQLTASVFAAVAAAKGQCELAMALLELDPETTRVFLADQIGYEPDEGI